MPTETLSRPSSRELAFDALDSLAAESQTVAELRERAQQLRQAIYDHELNRMQRELDDSVKQSEMLAGSIEHRTIRAQAMLRRSADPAIARAIELLRAEYSSRRQHSLTGKPAAKHEAWLAAVKAAQQQLEAMQIERYDDAEKQVKAILATVSLRLPEPVAPPPRRRPYDPSEDDA